MPLRFIEEHPREHHAPEMGTRPVDAMQAFFGRETKESPEVPARRFGLCLKIRSVPLEHQREDSKRDIVISRCGLLLLERGHLFVAAGAELHKVPPTDLGEDLRR